MSKPKRIWESIFKDQEWAFDFTNKVIIKDEYKTGKSYSWDIDKFDYNEDEYFVANEDAIKARNKQPIFEYENKKYISIKNDDSSYSILSTNKIIEKDNPINYDLLLANKLANHSNKDYVVLSISYQKIKPIINDIFISFISDSVKANVDFDLIKFNNDSVWKNKISFLINKSKFNTKKVLNFSMVLKSLFQMFVLRAKEKMGQIWEHDDEYFDKSFNIFVYSSDKMENIFDLNEKELMMLVETFEEKIILNENVKSELVEKGILSNDFTKIYEMDSFKIYSYNFVNIKFNSFYLKQKNK